MPQPASSTWEQWLDKIDGLTFVPESYEWPVTKLKNARRTELAPPSAHLPPGARFSKVPITFRGQKAILCAQCLH